MHENCPYSEVFGPHLPAFGVNTEICSVNLSKSPHQNKKALSPLHHKKYF